MLYVVMGQIPICFMLSWGKYPYVVCCHGKIPICCEYVVMGKYPYVVSMLSWDKYPYIVCCRDANNPILSVCCHGANNPIL